MTNKQQDISTAFFSDQIYVKCPKCASLGVINATLQNKSLAIARATKQHFNCTNCSYTFAGSLKWFGFYTGRILQNCKYCGSNLGFKTKPTKHKVDTQKATCDTCNKVHAYEIYWEKHFKNKAIDPYFGMDLWLQTAIKSNVLWAYNLEHLDFLHDYVVSKLREDNFRNKYSLITNLPQWIKDAKNRALIVKKLTKMKENFSAETKNIF